MGFPIRNKCPTLNSYIYLIPRVIAQKVQEEQVVSIKQLRTTIVRTSPEDHSSQPRSLVAGTLAGGPPAATVSRDVSSCPTWKREPHRHLLVPMVRCRRLRVDSPPDRIDSPWMLILKIFEVQELESTRQHGESI
ncbi:hypothetical protein PIB30_048993 [Stylosanthes scabra]|uniref:Uncharacterized protein n=1 Tax=Stylosanthes scabra TaxID=79078 RepID=A0ABU6YHS8_9FABA|nr:hypothetical protein [Stylosanthes scabra]